MQEIELILVCRIVSTLVVHEIVMIGFQLPVILEHLVQLVAESLFIRFDSRQLLSSLFPLILFLVEYALVLAFNLCNPLRSDAMSSL